MPVEMDQKFEEAVWAMLKINTNEQMFIGRVYRSPKSSDESNRKLCKLVKTVDDERYSKVIIMGDFYYPQLDLELETSQQKNVKHDSHVFMKTLLHTFWKQDVKHPTRSRLGNEMAFYT